MGLIVGKTPFGLHNRGTKSENRGKVSKIDEAIAKSHEKVVKLLLYGTGEGGKTTILRQMRLAKGDNLSERQDFRAKICINVIEGAALALRFAKHNLEMDFDDNEHATVVLNAHKSLNGGKSNVQNAQIDAEIAGAIKVLYKDKSFNEILKHRSKFQIHDCWDYFADKLANEPGYPEWGGPSWLPSKTDLLHARTRSTGRSWVNFTIEGVQYQLIDVGGQQAERRKFFAMFKMMDAVLFVASLSEYDQLLFEDESTNRLTETMKVWERTVNHSDFESTWFLVFLNKFDLFQQKYKQNGTPIIIDEEMEVHEKPPLPEEDDESCKKALQWYQDLFMSKVHSQKAEKQQVRIYVTNALDQQGLKNVMEMCTGLLQHNFAAAK